MKNKRELKPLPKVGSVYNHFDDGKVRESRRSQVVITEIIPFEKADFKILDLWKGQVEYCGWLFTKETDFFVRAIKSFDKPNYKTVEFLFARDVDGGWFSLNIYGGGSLDVDGSLMKLLLGDGE